MNPKLFKLRKGYWNVSKLYFIIIFSLIFPSVILPVFAEIESPRQQIENGIASQKITCNEGLVLMIRPSGMPVCIKPSTAERFQEFGWEKIIQRFEIAQKQIETIPASQGSIANFYITDMDLNTNHNGVDIIDTEDILEFTVNGIPISGPKTMTETGPNTGKFYVKLSLPDTINNQPLKQDDVVLIRYLDESDNAGEKRVLVKSFVLTKTFAKIETSGGGSRIGHEFTVRIYEPDANRDSRDEDKIPLTSFIFKGEKGLETTLANPRFDANRPYLLETGPNTSTFEVKIKIPREIDGKVIHIGDRYEIKYIDRTTPSDTAEKIVLKGRIG